MARGCYYVLTRLHTNEECGGIRPRLRKACPMAHNLLTRTQWEFANRFRVSDGRLGCPSRAQEWYFTACLRAADRLRVKDMARAPRELRALCRKARDLVFKGPGGVEGPFNKLIRGQ